MTLDVTLEVGTLEETITVTADAPLIETSNASHADVLDAKTLETLPSVGRNVFLMAVTVPTVQSSGDTHWNRMQDQTGASAISMGGGGVRANNYLLDGFPITDLQNRSSTNPSGEMLEDVRVQVHTYDAEMGRTGGGVFNTTAKLGLATSSADRRFYLRAGRARSSAAASSTRFAASATDDQESWRNGGGGVGGPIIRSKTFFWVAGETYRDGQSQNNDLHVPTRGHAQRRLLAADRHAGPPDHHLRPADDRCQRQPPAVPGQHHSRRTASTRSAATCVNALPLPDAPNVDNGNFNYFRAGHHRVQGVPGVAQARSPLQRLDLAERRLPVSEFVGADRNYFPDAPLRRTELPARSRRQRLRAQQHLHPQPDDGRDVPLRHEHVRRRQQPAVRVRHARRSAGTRRLPTRIPVQKFPSLTLTGYAGTGFTGVSDRDYYSWGVNGSLTKLAGSHSFKIGADYRILGVDALNYGQSAGSLHVQRAVHRQRREQSRRPPAAMRLPTCCSATRRAARSRCNSRFDNFVKYYGMFVQDDWRVTDKLTVNYGVRLEHETGLAEANNQLVVGFDRNVVSPLNVTIPADPVAGTPARQVHGRPHVRRRRTARTNTSAIRRRSRRRRASGSRTASTTQTVLRGGYGLFWAPWASGVQSAIGYSQTTALQQDTHDSDHHRSTTRSRPA